MNTPGTWPLRASALLLALIGVVPMAHYVTDGPGFPWFESAAQQWLVWGGGLAALVAALSLAAPALAARITTALAALLVRPPRWAFLAMIAIATLLLSLFFGWRIVGLEPVAGDEFAQRFQAHLLSLGHLVAQGEPQPEFFSTSETLTVNGRWFAQFPIGGPAFLALGLTLRLIPLLNPILTAVAVCAIYVFASRILDESTARVAALCCVLSPFLLFMSGTEMNHVPTLTAVWVGIAALALWRSSNAERGRTMAAVVIGVAIGIAATIRPYDAALAAACIGAFQLQAAVRAPELRRSLVAQCVAGAVPVLLLLLANRAMTGHPLTFAYDVLNGTEHQPGFHMTPLGFEHTPRRGLYIISAYLLKLDVMLLGWPVPAILLVVLTMAALRSRTEWDGFLLAFLWCTLAGYFVYWGESYFLGPRFLYVVAPVLLIYVARMPGALRDRIRRPALRDASALVPLAWLAIAWLLPVNPKHNFGVATLERGAVTGRTISSLIVRAVQSSNTDSLLVFIPESWRGRLAARLRALDLRPLEVEEMLKRYSACTIQAALDSTARVPGISNKARADAVWLALYRDPPAVPLPGMSDLDQIALSPRRPVTASCAGELTHMRTSGITLAELLPFESFDADGRLGGAVVYARDFGSANERLRPRFGSRRWLTLRTQVTTTGARVDLLPYTAPQAPNDVR